MVLFGKKYWQGLLRWAKNTSENGAFISPGDLDLVTVTDDPQVVVDVILDYKNRVGPPEVMPKTLS